MSQESPFLGLPGISSDINDSASAPPSTIDRDLYSLMLLGMPFRPVLPPPTASFDQADEQIFCFLYSGILVGAPVSNITTDQEKWSLMLIGMPFRNIFGTLEDGILDQGDEQQAAFLYSGILAQDIPLVVIFAIPSCLALQATNPGATYVQSGCSGARTLQATNPGSMTISV